ncbi:MAG: 4Fe-4S dicluster domain-containing protein [Candidatus Heimdallarchaeaceae archaeon]
MVAVETVLLILVFLTSFFNWHSFLQWSVTLFLILLFLSMDLKGSTPIYKSGLHEESLFRIYLDKEKCKGIGECKEVCPRECFEIDKKEHLAKLVRADLCVQCGACIVQCPLDALAFKNNKGEIIKPEIIRKYKLNLLGKRIKN